MAEAPPIGPGSADEPPDDSAAAFVRRTAVMSVGTALSRLTGFLRLAAMAYALGITEEFITDAYNIANVTPNILYELVLGGILTSVVVPVVVAHLQEHGRDEAWDVVRRLLSLALLVLAAIAVLAILLAPWIIDLYTVGVPEARRDEVRELSTFFLRWFMPQIVFYGVGAIATGLLNTHRRFAAPMFAPVLNNVIVIGTFVAFRLLEEPGVVATQAQRLVLAVGTTAGVAGMTLALWPFVRATGFRWRWRTGWRHEAVLRMGRLATWVFLYVVANQAGFLVVMVLAGGVLGGFSAYSAAFIVFQLPHAIFAVSIFTALLPAMSSRWAARDVDGFRATLSQGIRATAAIVLPAAVGYLVLARPIVRLLLEHGVTTPASGRLVSDLLVAFSIGLLPFSAFQLLLRAYYSMQDTRTPALVNLGALCVNVVVNLILFFGLDLGMQGLALGHAASYVFGSGVLLWLIRRRLGRIDGRRIAATVGRTAVAAGATAGVAWTAARVLGEAVGTTTVAEQSIQVFGAVAAGLAAFVAGAMLLRIEEVAMVRRQLEARWRR
ncbi:MAG TPA: murein biosynthesis integral membrane protein MurJ [Actinomycetota bacterium]